MRFADIFKLSMRMFKARTSRTLLTILGMSVGIGAILFLVSLGYGLQKTLLERITTSESLLTLDVAESKSSIVKLNKDVISKLEKMEGVQEVSPAFQLTSQGKIGELSADLLVTGARPSFLRLGGFKVNQGKLLNDDNAQQVVITSAVSQVFGKEINEILGQKIKFTFFISKQEEVSENLQSNFEKIESDKEYEIAGVIEGEENVIYVNSASLDNLGIERFNEVKVKCDSSNVMNAIRDKIIENGLLVSSLSDTVDQANKVFRIIQMILVLFGIIALVVSAIGMFNTMTIALLERTEEIGIMKSIGASNAAISLMFIMESSIMGFLGGLGGVAMGFVGGKIFNYLINFIAERFGGEPVNLFYSPAWFILLIISFAAFVGFSTGFIPAKRASKVDPLEALRYK